MTGVESTVGKPVAVRLIIVLSWIRVVGFALIVVLAIVLVSPMPSENMEAFRQGWIRGSGFSPDTYSYQQAGELAGIGLIPAALAALLLMYIGRRRLAAARVTAGLGVLVSVVQPLALVLTAPTLILTLLKSTADYCGDNPPSHAVR